MEYRKLIVMVLGKMFSPEGLREVVDPFTSLASSIMGQQVCVQNVSISMRAAVRLTKVLPNNVYTSYCCTQLKMAGTQEAAPDTSQGLYDNPLQR
jgi:3-methyladenine DNA glycosylase/8-oxoguanine DNA glycosylase